MSGEIFLPVPGGLVLSAVVEAHGRDSLNRTATTFLVLTVIAAVLAAASFAIRIKGYGFGTLGIERLDMIANAATFIPIAAIYAFSAMFMMILPVRGAGFVYQQAASPVWAATLVLLATILGLQITRFGFGDHQALSALLDWRFGFAAAIVAIHLFLDQLRSNALTRTLAFACLALATLACLYWDFRL